MLNMIVKCAPKVCSTLTSLQNAVCFSLLNLKLA